jgi:hypothetical protein
MKLLLFFIDGLGLGKNYESNPGRFLLNGITDIPFTVDSVPAEFSEGMLLGIDATGGIPGLPQSATGQTMLMTGVNASALLGYHLTAFPNETLVDLICERNILGLLSERGVSVTASNLYSPEYFHKKETLQKKRGKNAFPVSALSIRSSRTPFRFMSDYNQGKALFADLTNHALREKGFDIPLISPEDAADRMADILKDVDFVFHEYFVTDTYAHKKRLPDLERALSEVNRFLVSLREKTDPEETAVLLVSDHGNCEDTGSADHTRNPVPLLLLCRKKEARDAFRGISRLEEVPAGILAYFGLPAEDEILENDCTWL